MSQEMLGIAADIAYSSFITKEMEGLIKHIALWYFIFYSVAKMSFHRFLLSMDAKLNLNIKVLVSHNALYGSGTV